MAVPVKNFMIRHVSGAKANQLETFDFNAFDKLTFGRSMTSDIRFDPEIDTVVSREHGSIVKESDQPLQFSVVDHQSRNGIYVNKVRVNGSQSLYPGDEIRLGDAGPAFIFDIDPRPQDVMPQTRLMEVVKPTVEFSPPAAAPAAPEKAAIGRHTFERVINSERQKSRRIFSAALVAAIVIFGALGFVMWQKSKADLDTLTGIERKRADSLLALNSNLTKQQIDSVLAVAREGQRVAYDKIAAANADKVVKIYVSWELYEVSENEELFHEYRPDENGNYHPLFIRTESGLEPYLVTKRHSRLGIPVGSSGAGSGFVVTDDGKILTNRHVASAWKTRYDGFAWDYFPGYTVDGFRNGEPVLSRYPVVSQEEVFGWVPSESTLVNGRPAQVEGRNKYLKVVFANSSQPYESHLVTASQTHDVALVRVDISGLEPVTMLDNYNSTKAGQSIVVMGYPGGAPQQRIVRKSNDPMKPNAEVFTIASPVTSPGFIQQIVKSSTEFSPIHGGFGDSYQLDLNATGQGNSGGPMFDEKGNVIGIYYAGGGSSHSGIISFAVPIKYGIELLSVQRSL